MRGPFNGAANFAGKVITRRWDLSRMGEAATNCNDASMEKGSIPEIKLLSSFELCETKRAICRMILAPFESYKREAPSCAALISFSGASAAKLNSPGGNGPKGQNWLLSGRRLHSKRKHLRGLREVRGPGGGQELGATCQSGAAGSLVLGEARP